MDPTTQAARENSFKIIQEGKAEIARLRFLVDKGTMTGGIVENILQLQSLTASIKKNVDNSIKIYGRVKDV